MSLGSGIRNKPIPDPGSRGQKGTGSGSATLTAKRVSGAQKVTPAGHSVVPVIKHGDFARPSKLHIIFVCNTRPVAFGLKKADFPL
jgi:hypothetical protein